MGIVNNFPVFEADQVLTNDHLNNLFKYLDQQDRLTRCKLIGSGIVCGLEIKYDQQGIHISKGSALTSQGFMALHCENDYTRYLPFAPRKFPAGLEFINQCNNKTEGDIPFFKPGFEGELLQLITNADFDKLDAAEKAASITLSNAPAPELDKYAVVLFLETEQLNLKNCDTNDCNDKGSKIDFDVKFLLVKKTTLDDIRKAQGDTTGDTSTDTDARHVYLKRYNVPVNNLNSSADVLKAFTVLVNDSLLDKLSIALSNSYTNNKFLFENELQDPFSGLAATLKQMRDKIISTQPILIQYFYDFIDDLIKAYHEFLDNLVDITSECCGNEMRFPLHVMLGEANKDSSNERHDAYRQYFIYSSLFDSQKEKLETIRILFTRMKLMAEEFSTTDIGDSAKKTIKITPSSNSSSALSKRCIPYYYQLAEAGKELYRVWDQKKTRKGLSKFNLSYNASLYTAADHIVNPLLYDIEGFDFFRIEGHIGKTVNDALIKIKQAQQKYNCPFDMVAVSADYIGALLRGEEPKCIIQDLESDYRVLIAEFVCRVHDALCLASKIKYTGKPTRFPGIIATPIGNIRLAASIRLMNAQPGVNIGPTAGFGAATAASTVGTASHAPATATSTAAASTFPSGTDLPIADDEDEDKLVINAINRLPDATDHIFVSSLVNEYQASKKYQKGETLARLCNPAVGMIGNKYISIIKSNNGDFRNPVTVNALGPTSALTHEIFEFIDRAEYVFKILMSTELADLNINEFKRAFALFEIEVDKLKRVSPRIAAEVEMTFDSCIVERLEALKNEYLRRIAQFRMAKNFNYYFKKHPGIEHKAGVCKGGTFVLVYHEERRNRFIDTRSLFINKELSTLMMTHFQALLKPAVKVHHLEFQANLLKTATLYKDPELFMRFKDVMQKYLDECHDLPEERRKEITKIISKSPEQKQFDLTDEMVIADFYVPYLCCSDCPPITYILPSAPADEVVKPALTIEPLNICSNSDGSIKLSVNRLGGVFIIDGIETQENISQASDNLYLLARKGLEWAPHEIAYKIGLDISPVQKLTVTKAPGAKIIPILPGEASPGDQITFDASQSTGIDGNSSFEWIVTGNSALINKTEKKFIYTVQPNDEKLTVQLKVSNGTCPDLSKDFVIHINRNIDLIKESVCSDKTKVNLKSKFPEGAVLVDGAEIMSEEFIVKPVSLNLAATKPFTVTYKINGTLAMAEITVVVANADFTMQLVNIPVGTGSNTRVGLVLKPNNSSTTKEWTIKQGRAVSDITDGVPIDITALHFTLSREIEITHIATSTESGITCPNTKTFTLNKEIVDHMRNNNNQPIDNHFVLR